jgi:hypothetical protein
LRRNGKNGWIKSKIWPNLLKYPPMLFQFEITLFYFVDTNYIIYVSVKYSKSQPTTYTLKKHNFLIEIRLQYIERIFNYFVSINTQFCKQYKIITDWFPTIVKNSKELWAATLNSWPMIMRKAMEHIRKFYPY